MFGVTQLSLAVTHAVFVNVWLLTGKFLIFCFAGGTSTITLTLLQVHFFHLGRGLWL